MTNWPDALSLTWMIAGLGPLGILFYRVIRYGTVRMVSLLAIGTVLLWISYHATPWLGILTEGWTNFLLQPEYVPDGIRLATLCMFAYVGGYQLSSWANSGRKNHVSVPHVHVGRYGTPMPLPRVQKTLQRNNSLVLSKDRTENRGADLSMFPVVPMAALIIGSLIIFTGFLCLVGDFDELMWSSSPRGEGQFDPRLDIGEKLKQVTRVAIRVAGPAMSMLLVFRFVGAINAKKIWSACFAFILITICNMPLMWSYSRGAGFVYIVMGIGVVLLNRRKRLILSISLIVGGAWLSWIGFTQRGTLNPGLGNFVASVVAPQPTTGAPGGNSFSIDPNFNPLNALDAWTAAVWAGGSWVPTSFLEKIMLLAEVIQPLPSEFVSSTTKVGAELTIVFGTWGSTGLTTPALAELYLLFGDAAALAMGAVGVAAAAIDRAFAKRRHWLPTLAFVAVLYGFVMQAHSGIRAATRPIVYVAVIALIWKMIALFAGYRSIFRSIGKDRMMAVRKGGGSLEARAES